jgi:hypothetical protein
MLQLILLMCVNLARIRTGEVQHSDGKALRKGRLEHLAVAAVLC